MIIPAFLTLNSMPMHGQDCIDISQIQQELDSIQDQCDCTDPLILGTPNQTTPISNYNLPETLFNECIEVYGTLLMDDEVVFIGCNFIFDQGALIEANDPFERLIFESCNLQSCGDYLWDGIKIASYTNIIFRNNTMRHSYNGLHGSSQDMRFVLSNNVFEDNRVAVNAKLSSGSHSVITAFGNIFSQTNDLKDHWSIGTLQGLDAVSYGIKAEKAIVNADASRGACLNTNIFLNLYRGYYLTDCEAVIKANLFHNFRNETVDGLGIFAESVSDGYTLDQQGWPTSDIGSFNNVRQPIKTLRSGVTIKGNDIINSREGIEVLDPKLKCIIADNDIQADHYGILLSGNRDKNMGILNNYISLDVDPLAGATFGIQVGYPENSLILGEVRGNVVKSNGGHFGMLFLNCNRHNISCNEVYIQETSEKYTSGIEFQGGGLNNRIRENMVVGQYSQTNAREVNGIKLVNSSANRQLVNEVEGTEFGFHFSGNNIGTRQEQNTFTNHDIGYFIDRSGITGTQWYPANQWKGTFALIEAQNEGFTNFSIYNEYANLQTTDCWPENIEPMIGWFVERPGPGVCGLPTFTVCFPFQEPEIEFLNVVDSMIASGEFQTEDYPVRRTWDAERYLYQILDRYQDIMSADSLMESFWNNSQESSIVEYHEINKSIASILEVPDNLVDDYAILHSAKVELFADANQALDDWLENPDSLEVLDAVSAFYSEVDSLLSLYNNEFNAWALTAENDLQNLLSDIHQLSTPNVYASNEKIVLEAMVRQRISSDSIDTSLETDLIALAEACNLEHGPSVPIASTILNYLGEYRLSFTSYCEDSGGNRIAPVDNVPQNEIQLYPNPTGNQLQLEWKAVAEQQGKLRVFNLLGQVVYSEQVDGTSGQHQLDLQELPQGQYLIHLSFERITHTEPFVINR